MVIWFLRFLVCLCVLVVCGVLLGVLVVLRWFWGGFIWLRLGADFGFLEFGCGSLIDFLVVYDWLSLGLFVGLRNTVSCGLVVDG